MRDGGVGRVFGGACYVAVWEDGGGERGVWESDVGTVAGKRGVEGGGGGHGVRRGGMVGGVGGGEVA